MIVMRSKVTVILPEIPQGRRTSPWRRWTNEAEPSVDERILTIATKTGTIEKKHNIVNTPHMTRHDAQPSMMHDKATWSYSWKEMMHTRATHQGKFKWGREQHITIPENPHMHILIWYCYALKHIVMLLNMQNNATTLNYAFSHPIYI